jgi:hypothetical protein
MMLECVIEVDQGIICNNLDTVQQLLCPKGTQIHVMTLLSSPLLYISLLKADETLY